MKKFTCLLLIASLISIAQATSENNFSTGVADYGIVVEDIDVSVEFYQTIGFRKFAEFSLPQKLSGDSGLTDYQELPVVVMTATGSETDTKVKLLQLPGKSEKQDQSYIDSTYGMSYQTFFVTDINKTLSMLVENEIAVLAKGPVDLSEAGFVDIFLVLIRDPDGNIIEFVGPRLED